MSKKNDWCEAWYWIRWGSAIHKKSCCDKYLHGRNMPYSGFVAVYHSDKETSSGISVQIAGFARWKLRIFKFGINLCYSDTFWECLLSWLQEFADEIRTHFIQGVNLEVAYNNDLSSSGILGLNADYANQYVKYVADRRPEDSDSKLHYNVTNPAKWMATATDVHELVNFFEAQNTAMKWTRTPTRRRRRRIEPKEEQ